MFRSTPCNSKTLDECINYSEFLAATLESCVLLDEDLLWRALSLFDVDKSGVKGRQESGT